MLSSGPRRKSPASPGSVPTSRCWGTLYGKLCGVRRSPTGLWVTIISIAFVATACGSGPSSMPLALHHKTSTTPKTAILTAEEVAVSPRTGLQDGQQVTVRVKGFKTGVPGIKFFLSECQSPLQVNSVGCGSQLAAQPFGLTDSNGDGSGSASFTVRSSAATKPLSSSLVPCAGTCVIVATAGQGGNYAFAPIAFAG
jgi:hypothetical protein